MNVPRDFSASTLFVECNVMNFPILREKKLVYALRSGVFATANVLVNHILYINHSFNAMHPYWKTILYL
jgi:hypothetical protein